MMALIMRSKALATGNFCTLTSLDVSINDIGIDGAQALITGNLSVLRSLNLSYNSLMLKR
jgi:hypothetical protein